MANGKVSNSKYLIWLEKHVNMKKRNLIQEAKVLEGTYEVSFDYCVIQNRYCSI